VLFFKLVHLSDKRVFFFMFVLVLISVVEGIWGLNLGLI
jgi:hypothetical protein